MEQYLYRVEELGFYKPRFKLCKRAQIALCNFWKNRWLEIRKKNFADRKGFRVPELQNLFYDGPIFNPFSSAFVPFASTPLALLPQ